MKRLAIALVALLGAATSYAQHRFPKFRSTATSTS